MSDKFTGTTVDIYSVAKNRQKINTKIALAQMPELCEFLHEPDLATELEVEITGIEGAKGLPAALLAVKGMLFMRCVRCMQPYQVDIDNEVPFLFAATEADADRLPVDEDDEWEVTVGSEHLNIADWVQEEVILSLPAFPKHDDCDSPEGITEVQSDDYEQEEKPNPFANLREMLAKKQES